LVGLTEVTAFRCCVIALWWLVLTPGSARASDGSIPPGQSSVRVFGGADGLRNLSISHVVQDREGFLWLGTDDGVYRFDGEKFTHFSTAEGLISNLILAVGIAPDGNVCVGGTQGLACWNGQRFSQANTRGLQALQINRMVSFAGRFWVGTETAGLYVQDATGSFVPAPGWPGRTTSIRALWADTDDLLVGDGAMVRMSTGDGTWREVGDVGITRGRVEEVLRDRDGSLWIRTAAHLWLLPLGATTAVDVHDGLPADYDVTRMVVGPRGNVLVATDRSVAYRELGVWRTLTLHDSAGAGTPSGVVHAVFVDREGTIWIASAGLIQLRGRGMIEHYDEASGLPGDTVWSYQLDRDGALWVGTNRCLAHVVARRWTCLPGTEGRVVRSIVFPPQGGVFFGGAPSDLRYIAPDGTATSMAFTDPADHIILALTLGPEGDLWIGTRGGLYRLPGAIAGAPLVRVELPGTHPNTRVASLKVVDDLLWTATVDGVLVLDRGTWRLFNDTHGFRHAAMRYVVPRADGRLCAAYSEPLGVACFRYRGRTIGDIEHIGPAEGLTSGKVYLVGEDAQRRLWVGTGDGVDVIGEYGIEHLDERDGLAGNDSSAMAFLLDRDGSLWLGATGGATHVFARDHHGPPRPPTVTFIAGRLGTQPIHDLRAKLEVTHEHSTLGVEFASSSMLDAKRVEYEVRLSPIETTWSATHQREARYPALGPGPYRFEVRARVGSGGWGATATLGFTILPAWWQTRWFGASAVLAALLLIVGVFAAGLRRRTRQLHARSDASFRAVIDLMPDLISVHRGGGALYLNLAHQQFLEGDEPGEPWDEDALTDRIHPDDREPRAELFDRVRLGTTSGSEVIELRMRGVDGSWRTCEVSGILVEIGGAGTVVASGRDITERKRLRTQLLVSDRMASLGTMAAGIAHEINNPLAYVTGNLEIVAETLHADTGPRTDADRAMRAEIVAAIGDARDGAERVRKIVHGLRSFSRSEEEERVPLALPGVLEAAIRLTANEVRHRALLVRELGVTPLVIADDGRLTQVFINLLINAAHAIPAGRSAENRITVRTHTDGEGRAVIEIEDTGAGIPAEVQSRVFDPFFTTKEIGVGTGLGLSICHGIISGLGGQISIESVVERGTVVRVVLLPPPALPAVLPAAPSEPTDAGPGPRRHRVLLVDDEVLIAQTLERLLRRDHDITIAQCGREALDHITGGAWFDAIISDVMMPNMTGIELLDELRRLAPVQADRLVFLSGGAFTAQTRDRLDALGVLQLEKPVTAAQLRACVLRVASEAKLAS
jgi:PAS domain S-box-containing protein